MPLRLPIVSKFDSTGVNQAQSGLNRLSGIASGIGATLGVAFAAVSVAAVTVGVESIKAASNFEEVTAAVEQVFGSAAQSLEDFAKTAPTVLGQTRTQFLDAVKTFGIFGEAAGLAGEDNAAFSQQLAILASDLASFNNTDVDTAITAIGAGLRGENEPLRQFGVLLDDATLKARAMEMGIYDGTGSLTAQQKVLAAQAEILSQTSIQQGDFARTQDGMANGARTLKAVWDDLEITIGQALLPAVQTLLPVMVEFIESLAASPAFGSFIDGLGMAFSTLTEVLIPLLDPIMDLIMVLLPPLLDIITLLAPMIGDLAAAFVPLLQGILPPLVSLIETLLPPIMDLVMAVFMPLIPIIVKLVEVFAPMIEQILPPLLDIITALVPIWFALIDAFLPLLDYLPSLFDLFMAIIDPLSQMIVDLLPFAVPLIQGMGDIIKWMVDNVLKPFIDGLSAAVSWLAELFGYDGRSLTVNGNMNFATGEGVPGVKLATGGIVMPRPGGTMATIGEAGQAEAVIPLNKLPSIMGNGGGGGGATYVVNVNGGLATSSDIGRAVVDAIKKFERTSGPVFAGA